MSTEREERHRVSACCRGERCRVCGQPASHKVEETLFADADFHAVTFDNGQQIQAPRRHPFSAYLCCADFRRVMGPAVYCPAPPRSGATPPTIYPEGMVREDLDE